MDYVLFVRSRDEDWLRGVSNADIRLAPFRHYSIAEQLFSPLVIARARLDLFFAPHFNMPLLCPTPSVATIHDLILHRFPNAASILRRLAYRIQMGSTVRRARGLIAVSAFTALELADAYGMRIQKKTAVIPEGVEEEFHRVESQTIADVRNLHQLPSSYFLYVGNAKEHKNLAVLLSAWKLAALPGQSLVLVTEQSFAQKNVLQENVLVRSDMDDRDLPALYSGATCFITPSLYEGYCLPAIEALSCGCPVIAANRTALPEVTHGSAMLVEPTIDALAHALQNHPKRPVAFTAPAWSDAAAATVKLLRHAIRA